jgi:hypothetical protein
MKAVAACAKLARVPKVSTVRQPNRDQHLLVDVYCICPSNKFPGAFPDMSSRCLATTQSAKRWSEQQISDQNADMS